MTLRFREMTRFDQSPWLVHGWVVIDIPALCFYVKCAYSASQLSLLIAASNCFFLLSLVTSLSTYMSKVYSLPLHLLEASEIVLICSCQSSWLWSEVLVNSLGEINNSLRRNKAQASGAHGYISEYNVNRNWVVRLWYMLFELNFSNEK